MSTRSMMVRVEGEETPRSLEVSEHLIKFELGSGRYHETIRTVSDLLDSKGIVPAFGVESGKVFLEIFDRPPEGQDLVEALGELLNLKLTEVVT